jgi:hypothetical protein
MLSEEQIGKLLSAQLFALMRDRRYGYASTPSFSNLNSSGKQIMAELVEMLVPKVVETIHAEDKERAEQLVVDNLKK